MEEQLLDHEIRPAIEQAGADTGRSFRKLLAMIWCEWLSRKWWFVLAGMIGVLVLFSPLLEVANYRPTTILAAAVAIIVIIFTPLFTFAAGLSMNFEEIGEQRRGFYLTKPLSGRLLWASKFCGGMALVITLLGLLALPGTTAIAFGLMWSVPAAEVDGTAIEETLSEAAAEIDRWERVDHLNKAALLGLVPLFLYAAAFWAGISLGTKTSWLGSDLVLVMLSGFLFWWGAARMRDLGLSEVAVAGLARAGLFVTLALIASGAVSLSRGRVSANRLHRHLSLTLWPLIAVALGGQALYNTWYLNPRLADLRGFHIETAAPSGSWIQLAGHRGSWKSRGSNFLFDISTGRSVPIGWGRFWVSYSEDGSTAAWIEEDERKEQSGEPVLHILRLDQETPEKVSAVLPWSGRLEVSPSGKRCAVISTHGIVVHEPVDGSLEREGHFPTLGVTCDATNFISETTLECRRYGSEVEVSEIIDLVEGTRELVEKQPRSRRRSYWGARSPSGETEVFWDYSARPAYQVIIWDTYSGDVRAKLIGEPYTGWKTVGFIDNERIAFLDRKTPELKILGLDGKLLQSIALGRAPSDYFVRVDSDTLMFSSRSSYSLSLVELKTVQVLTGKVERIASGLRPVVSAGFRRHQSSSRWMIEYPPRSPLRKLFWDLDGNLIFFDVATGERRVVLSSSS